MKLIIVKFSPFSCFGFSDTWAPIFVTPPVYNHPIGYESKSRIRIQLEQINMQCKVQFMKVTRTCLWNGLTKRRGIVTNFHRNFVNFITFFMNAYVCVCVCVSLTLDTFVHIGRVGGANLFYASKQLHFTSFQRGLPQNRLNRYVEEHTASFRVLRTIPIKIQVLDAQNRAKTLRNVGTYLLIDVASYSRRFDYSKNL